MTVKLKMRGGHWRAGGDRKRQRHHEADTMRARCQSGEPISKEQDHGDSRAALRSAISAASADRAFTVANAMVIAARRNFFMVDLIWSMDVPVKSLAVLIGYVGAASGSNNVFWRAWRPRYNV